MRQKSPLKVWNSTRKHRLAILTYYWILLEVLLYIFAEQWYTQSNYKQGFFGCCI